MDDKLTESTGAADRRGAAGHKGDWKYRVIHEGRHFLGLFLYLWAIFGLLLLHESVVLARYHLPFTRWGAAFVAALVLAKVMLVMEEFNVARGFEDRPLIYPIVYKSVVFGVVFVVFYIAEETVAGMLRGHTALESVPSIGGGTPLGMVVAVVIVSVALLPHFAFREVGRVLGEDELRALLFTRGRKRGASETAAKSAR
jgi:hypothetical protein